MNHRSRGKRDRLRKAILGLPIEVVSRHIEQHLPAPVREFDVIPEGLAPKVHVGRHRKQTNVPGNAAGLSHLAVICSTWRNVDLGIDRARRDDTVGHRGGVGKHQADPTLIGLLRPDRRVVDLEGEG